ncbi:MAG: YHS domain-containing protein [Planctomycetota bacterium]|nr:YHS domain-containing protein [Planctomycetota bacterium]MDA1161650.1 YHS domain-containing protein [Planctomycetota bacterium]
MRVSMNASVIAAVTVCLFAGCTGGSSPDSTTSAGSVDAASNTDSATKAVESGATESKPTAYRPVQLGGTSTATATGTDEVAGASEVSTAPPKFEDIVKALKPIQIMLGRWQGIIQKASKNEVHDWVWDLKSDPVFPALVLDITDGEFFTNARITFDPRIGKYQMTTSDAENIKRSFVGEFTAAPKDVPSEDGKTVERTFELQLTEVFGEPRGTRFQYVFKQQHNNRYLVEVKRARGTAGFRQIDVIGSQREGVSFAKADDDYGDKTCIISGGLGTSTVTYKGKTYYVCCSGCKAAFDDEPERWIARLEEQKAEKMKSN